MDRPDDAPQDEVEAARRARRRRDEEHRRTENPRSPQSRLRAQEDVVLKARWVDHVVEDAIARGEFDDLPLQGKPIPSLGTHHDPDWWVKQLVEREHVTGVLPEALQLRTDDARLDAHLDRERTEAGVRAQVEEFNRRIVEARRQLLGGPPVVTPLRDVETEVERWRSRRERPTIE
ncbi:DUF1992 domain-containing protein [Luteimicrobium subarcticum]|uniref:Uncharacterized protein DUF1992 n=1 Tax=Luteimicrobium subarcticum TaxID=620910 RepID=A0A2M8W1R1_9MICO|nr:DUF1992 domain-containing protein [Luteimicrobium subarcticum]PJI84867.1 uncharacterized protein DUF1992 [Luteimicrobium subarcticum]